MEWAWPIDERLSDRLPPRFPMWGRVRTRTDWGTVMGLRLAVETPGEEIIVPERNLRSLTKSEKAAIQREKPLPGAELSDLLLCDWAYFVVFDEDSPSAGTVKEKWILEQELEELQ
ncbi:MAG TPA: hypothetical protein V6D14_03280 [Coleofasciculaceae cyanobacterium]|jgi:hypothetical protein